MPEVGPDCFLVCPGLADQRFVAGMHVLTQMSPFWAITDRQVLHKASCVYSGSHHNLLLCCAAERVLLDRCEHSQM